MLNGARRPAVRREGPVRPRADPRRHRRDPGGGHPGRQAEGHAAVSDANGHATKPVGPVRSEADRVPAAVLGPEDPGDRRPPRPVGGGDGPDRQRGRRRSSSGSRSGRRGSSSSSGSSRTTCRRSRPAGTSAASRTATWAGSTACGSTERDADGVKMARGQINVGLVDMAKKERVRALVTRWFRERAEVVFGEVFDAWTREGRTPRHRAGRRSRSARWRTAGEAAPTEGHILLNPDLIVAPMMCIEYVDRPRTVPPEGAQPQQRLLPAPERA